MSFEDKFNKLCNCLIKIDKIGDLRNQTEQIIAELRSYVTVERPAGEIPKVLHFAIQSPDVLIARLKLSFEDLNRELPKIKDCIIIEQYESIMEGYFEHIKELETLIKNKEWGTLLEDVYQIDSIIEDHLSAFIKKNCKIE